MAPTDSQLRMEFLDFTARDRQLLQALRPLLETHVATVVDVFYEHLLEFPDTAQLLRERTTVDHLKRVQRYYLMRITDGAFDEDYFADRIRIGQTHERVGLSSRWYLLAYSLYFKLLAPEIWKHYAANPEVAGETLLALQKAFMLDASLAMEAYIASDRYRHLRQLESIVNDSADVIFLLDNEGRYRAWNRAAERIFGWGTEEILGKPLSVIFPPELLDAGEMERIDENINRSGHYHFESVRMAKDGRRIPVEITVSLLRDPQGTPLGRSAILRDITERKHTEEEKLRSERLAVIGAMSAKLAHEIRNPLSSIKLNIDLVGDEIKTLSRDNDAVAGEARGLLHSLDSEVRRIQRVTEDYLQFARMPKSRREIVLVNQVLEDGLTFMKSLFDATGIIVHTEFDESLPPVQADEGQLWQAILNLVRNALEAMPGGGTLTVRTGRTATHAVITVSDTGKGMTKDEMAQMYKPFFSTKTGGTGLGLPLTQQVVTEHGARIHCESVPRQGTTFTIELPLT